MALFVGFLEGNREEGLFIGQDEPVRDFEVVFGSCVHILVFSAH